MRLIDADELKRAIEDRIDYVPSNDHDEGWNSAINTAIDEIDNAPTVEDIPKMCKTCKYYHPYYVQFSDVTRGDGYCQIARMTPEGMTTINCNDYFGCADYEKRS